ncbi:hypothetical protein OKA05_16800 [Luteolibacter arcticus]|uniref:PEP-CTERM protein-sorting domain-containing protein n=1 Tax=Luteolibacter arcticus TaxID=1581411 RepID=A0ABT3GL30_9BACT|nr:hypothetical protein [Luteolibacter arcticus]MCW1924228.1 hypothetical protein [Luteolibacter arcticus]
MKLLLAALIALVTPAFSATAIVDQVTGSTEEGGLPSVVGPVDTGESVEDIYMAQTITAGVEGYLSRVDLWLSRQSGATGDLVLSILNADGAPEGAPLMTITIAASSIASSGLFDLVMVSVDVRSWDLHFGVGDTFAIALGAPDAPPVGTGMPAFAWAGDGLGGYAAGERYFLSSPEFPDWTSSEGTTDQIVRTWVEPASIPEPSCLVLAGAGVLLVRRKRR